MTEHEKQAEREAFEKDAEPYGYDLTKAKCGCCTYCADETEHRFLGWQARGEYESERVLKLVEAIRKESTRTNHLGHSCTRCSRSWAWGQPEQHDADCILAPFATIEQQKNV